MIVSNKSMKSLVNNPISNSKRPGGSNATLCTPTEGEIRY